jgi:photosystem II stability/assembly factor-like uncharacterized protein
MHIKRLALPGGLALLGLILTLLCAQATTVDRGRAAPAGWEEWTPLGGPVMEGGQVNALAVHPDDSGTVYAAIAPPNAYDSGPSTLYKTIDGATSWEPVYVADHQVYALAAAGTNVYAGAFNRGGEGVCMYASQDSGVTWTPVMSFTDRGVWLDISIDASDPEIAVAGGWVRPPGANADQGVVYFTDDGGLSWTPALTVTYPDQDSAVNAVLIYPDNPTVMVAAARVGTGADSVIYRSEDGGATWPVTFTIEGAHAMSLAAHPSEQNILYAGTGPNQQGGTWGPNQVHRSTDLGITWQGVTSDTGGLVAAEPPATVYALGSGFWASYSDGDQGSWNLLEGEWPGDQINFDLDLGTTPATLYVGGRWSGVSKSTNGGTEWALANNGIEILVTPIDIDVDRHDANKLIVAADTLGGWVSDDGGQTWTMPSGLATYMFSFGISPEDSDIVYGGASGCSGVVRSDDGGFNYTTVYSPPHCLVNEGYENFRALVIAESDPDTVYAGGGDGPPDEDTHAAIVRSLDDGVSWTEVFTLPSYSEVRVLAINPQDADVVYAGGEDCHTGPGCHGFVYRTTDGGESWDLSLVVTDTVRSIVIDPRQPNEVYMADDGYWVRKSSNGGDSWVVVRPPWWMYGEPSGNKLAIDPHLPGHVFLGGWGYIAETRDGGVTWSEWSDPLNNGTPQMEPGALAVGYGMDTQTVYGGFSGVWTYTRVGPLPWQVHLPLVLRTYSR